MKVYAYSVGIVLLIFFILSIAGLVYTFQKCGMKTFLFGNAGFVAAVTGLCDE